MGLLLEMSRGAIYINTSFSTNTNGVNLIMILRIIDKDTQLFKRDDFTFDEATELGLDVEPSQGLSTTPLYGVRND